MFKKILIANRGEIAVRVIRACRDLGISPVAVYSEVDRASLHVRLADEAYLLGPAPSTESYLVIERVIEAAKRCGAEAIHPGYGFLSENPSFAEACADAGIPFIGPSAESMRMMGNKTTARSVLQQAGVQIVPGTCEALRSPEEAAREAGKIGYPVMLKATAGGGGKGMRLIEDASRIAPDFEAASSEAQNAFGNPSVYLEKYIQRPRHIEIQVLADHEGRAIYLGERECSIQRRHQKVVEECPSPLVDEPLRRKMGEAALKVVRAAKYVNAGTVEFLMDENRNFYFLEMNTRLQVEHPVTEMVTGLDLVIEQIRIAAGERLRIEQSQVQMRGWALECRIYAEDPDHGFMPSPGRIKALNEPQGPGIRVDSGVYEGCEIPIHYDPLMAKLVAAGADREEAIARMKRALREYRLQGIKSNLGFFLALLSDGEFAAGRLSTKFIEEFMQREQGAAAPECPDAAAVAAALAYREREGILPVGRLDGSASAWRVQGRSNAWKMGQGWRQ